MYLTEPIKDKNTTEKIIPQNDLIYACSLMQGCRTTMEDAVTTETNIPGFENYSFFGVYDGHCGKRTAEHISKVLHLNIFKKLRELGEENIEQAIKAGFMQTDNEWKVDPDRKVGSGNGDESGSAAVGDESGSIAVGDESGSTAVGDESGSTAVIAIITPDQTVYIGNAGDSRAVMSVSTLQIPLSEDHYPKDANERQRILKAGGSISFYGRLNGDLNLSRAFGKFEHKGNSSIRPEEQALTAYPDVKFHKIDADTDFLVLASDGIWWCKSSQKVIDFINKEIWLNKDLGKACENLMNDCVCYGHDNMSVIIIGFLHGLEKEQWLDQIGHKCDQKQLKV